MRESIRRVDTQGVEQRREVVDRRIRRRVYDVPFPHFMWHIDGNHKLIRWKMVIHAAIDGFSRLLLYIHCSDNNKAETVMKLFSQAVQTHKVVPRKIRTDYGTENTLLWNALPTNHMKGPSVHNQRIERQNRDINCNIRARFGPLFYSLENAGQLDVGEPLDLSVLHVVFLPRINEALQSFMDAHNNHKIRTERNSTPIQLVMQNMPKYNITDEEMQNYHIPDLPPPDTYHTDGETLTGSVRLLIQESGIDLLRDDHKDGCEVYNQCREYVSEHLRLNRRIE